MRCSRFASNLSLGWQPSQRPQGDSPGSRQRPFGLGNFRPIRRVMDSPCLSAGGIRFLNLRVPAGELGRASEDRLAYRVCARTTTGLPRSAPVRHDRGGCCLYSGAVVSALEPVRRSSPLLARSSPFQPSYRRPYVTEPHRQFTCVHPSALPLARFARMVRVCLGLHPSAVARFVTWRLQGSGTGLDTIQSRDNESRLLNLVQSRVATNLRRCVRPTRVNHLGLRASVDWSEAARTRLPRVRLPRL